MHLGALYTPYVKNRGEYWRFITSAFIHTEFLHLFMNMYCIFYLGRMFETLLGPVRYLILVLVSIVMSSLATYYYSYRDSSVDNSITIGASGLFYGFLGAIIGLGLFKGGAFMAWVFNAIGMENNTMAQMPWYEHLVLGGFCFGAVFMATDPVTSARTERGKYIFGFLIGVMAIVIRVLNPGYPEGMMLAILLMNIFAPLIDYCVVQGNISRREKRAIKSNQ